MSRTSVSAGAGENRQNRGPASEATDAREQPNEANAISEKRQRFHSGGRWRFFISIRCGERAPPKRGVQKKKEKEKDKERKGNEKREETHARRAERLNLPQFR